MRIIGLASFLVLAMLPVENSFGQRVVVSPTHFKLTSNGMCLTWGGVDARMGSCLPRSRPEPEILHWFYHKPTAALKGGNRCLASDSEGGTWRAVLKDCDEGNMQKWNIMPNGQVRHAYTRGCLQAGEAGTALMAPCDRQALGLVAPAESYTQARPLRLQGSDLDVTLQAQRIGNHMPIILDSRPDNWLMTSDGKIVRPDHPEFGLTVLGQDIRDGTRIILHEGDNDWMVLRDGSIVLKSRPEFGLFKGRPIVTTEEFIVEERVPVKGLFGRVIRHETKRRVERRPVERGNELVLLRNDYNQWSWGEIETLWLLRDRDGLCLEIPEHAINPLGGAAKMATCGTTSAQLEYTDAGELRFAGSATCLGPVEVNGLQLLRKYSCSGEPDQKWALREKPDELRNEANGLCLQTPRQSAQPAMLVDCIGGRQTFARGDAYVVSFRKATRVP